MPYVYNPFISNLDDAGNISGADVVGPGTSTDEAVALWNGTDGKLLKDSLVLIDGSGNVTANSIILTTNLAVADGGTAASTTTGARTNLGVAIGSDVQAYSIQLDSAASVGDGIIAHIAANTFTPRTITGTANEIDVSNGDGVAGNPTVGLVASPHITSVTFDSGSNFLANYEEGTFTPVVIGTSTPGTATYSIQIGNYTRIGNRVFFTINLTWSAGSGSGNLKIDGLPYTVNASNGTSPCSVSFGSDLTIAASTSQVFGYIIANSTTIGFGEVIYNSSAPAVAYDAASLINISGHYYI